MPLASAHYKAPDTDLAGTLWGAEAGGLRLYTYTLVQAGAAY
jgi:hypothetical protein